MLLSLSSLTIFTNAFSSQATARKKLGKKSFIEKQERGKLQKIASSTEIQELASKNKVRSVGSSYYLKAWRHWRTLAIEAIRFELSKNLPHPSDKAKFENLFFQLGVAADEGKMPSFSDKGARSGYALEFFCRGRNLADLFILDTLNPLHSFSDEWTSAILNTPLYEGNGISSAIVESSFDTSSYNMVSLGGGPGFDFVGAALATTFNSNGLTITSPLRATILDYEEGWSDLVTAMDTATRNILQQPNLSCKWGGKCDITKPMNDPSNIACRKEISSTNLWTCQYCVAENRNLLHESNFIFFKDLFELAPDGAIFIFTETTPRIWPDFCKLIEHHFKGDMEVGFNKNGRQMLLRKGKILTEEGRATIMMNDHHANQLEKYSKIVECHERKLSSGYQRQQQKIRGAK